jgi:hypothetical protein
LGREQSKSRKRNVALSAFTGRGVLWKARHFHSVQGNETLLPGYTYARKSDVSLRSR